MNLTAQRHGSAPSFGCFVLCSLVLRSHSYLPVFPLFALFGYVFLLPPSHPLLFPSFFSSSCSSFLLHFSPSLPTFLPYFSPPFSPSFLSSLPPLLPRSLSPSSPSSLHYFLPSFLPFSIIFFFFLSLILGPYLAGSLGITPASEPKDHSCAAQETI